MRSRSADDHMGLEDRVEIDRSVVGFSARGWLGQYLVVVPSKRIVAVRMRAETRADHSGQAEEDEDHAFIAQLDRAVTSRRFVEP